MELFILYSFFIFGALPEVEAAGYSQLCPLKDSPLVQLEYDTAALGFFLVAPSNDSESGRLLWNNSQHLGILQHTYKETSFRQLLQSDATKHQTYKARQCMCSTIPTYCLVDPTSSYIPDTCGVRDYYPFRMSSPYSYGTFVNYSKYNSTPTVECFRLEGKTIFVRNVWPVIVLWYGALLIFFVATLNGKYVRMCLFNAMCPGLRVNERHVDRMIRRENETAARWRADHSAEERRRRLVSYLNNHRLSVNTQDETTRHWQAFFLSRGMVELSFHEAPHVEYVLKTKTYDTCRDRAQMMTTVATRNDSDSSSLSPILKIGVDSLPSTPETVVSCGTCSDQLSECGEPRACEESDRKTVRNVRTNDDIEADTIECTICLTEVRNGEQIGVLACSHLFHVDCLKQWIVRRNTCPLCLSSIATPRPVDNRQEIIDPESAFDRDLENTPDENDAQMPRYRPSNRPQSLELRESSLPATWTLTDTMNRSYHRERRRRRHNRGQEMQHPRNVFAFTGW